MRKLFENLSDKIENFEDPIKSYEYLKNHTNSQQDENVSPVNDFSNSVENNFNNNIEGSAGGTLRGVKHNYDLKGDENKYSYTNLEGQRVHVKMVNGRRIIFINSAAAMPKYLKVILGILFPIILIIVMYGVFSSL